LLRRVLAYNQQLELHAFYQPSKNLTDDESSAHRQQISQEQPSLPNRAGKLFAEVERYTRAIRERMEQQPPQDPAQRVRVPVGQTQRHIHVLPLARSEVDIVKLAGALLDLAEQMQVEAASERGVAA
jgi:hypothetical protein